jgi:hypothetical protein
MMTTSSSLVPSHLGSQVARRLLGVLAPSVGLFVVLAITASTMPVLFSRGGVILAAAIVASRTRR